MGEGHIVITMSEYLKETSLPTVIPLGRETNTFKFKLRERILVESNRFSFLFFFFFFLVSLMTHNSLKKCICSLVIVSQKSIENFYSKEIRNEFYRNYAHII